MQPVVLPIDYKSPTDYFKTVADKPYAVLLDSAQQHPEYGRFSVFACEPFSVIEVFGSKVYENKQLQTMDVFSLLQQKLAKYNQNNMPELPLPQPGIIGFFGYELAHQLEKLPPLKKRLTPDAVLGFYDCVVSFDQYKKQAFIISTGLPEENEHKRFIKATKKAQQLKNMLANFNRFDIDNQVNDYKHSAIKADFTKANYIQTVEKIKNFILEGDIFEANLSQRFSLTTNHTINHYALFKKLQKTNPAPFSAFLNCGDTHILSSSPERFLSLNNKRVEARPIKGTIKRHPNSAIDAQLKNTLQTSEKDRAENIMIVDLMRNDLSRVCEPFSVTVEKLCGLETYENVHHLVSVVKGTLESPYTIIDLLKAAFPPGSVTGAPKIRALEIIHALEPCARGPYCGAIGYINFNGNADFNVTIRTLVTHQNTLSFHTGGAIVTDSSPEAEYNETLLKAEKLFQSLVVKNNKALA